MYLRDVVGVISRLLLPSILSGADSRSPRHSSPETAARFSPLEEEDRKGERKKKGRFNGKGIKELEKRRRRFHGGGGFKAAKIAAPCVMTRV
ncbi:BnaAnng39790D [Brassica napus]|uniref:BnaAnng39790D protein n=1 Tax=Brassica napus TaxID=3708 RepID=A0A078K082_BRANA|nr:BnaAnng39790D [Brassica napus]